MFSNNVRRAKSVRCVLHSELMELDKKAPETLPCYATPCRMQYQCACVRLTSSVQ